MKSVVSKAVFIIAILTMGERAFAETPSQEVASADTQSEAMSTNVAYCTTGQCFNHVNDVNLTENRYNELLKVTGTLDDRKDLPQYNFGAPKGTK